MCTVTYIPLENGFVLTSSRDERVLRQTLKPALYTHDNNILLVYPKDQIAGGTWIAMSNNRIACLLNGGFVNHEKLHVYSKSRGVVLLEYFNSKSILNFIETIDLKHVEPFTLLLINNQNEFEFKELVWDGKVKHVASKECSPATIWSSSTLYSEDDRLLRRNWFNEWIYKNDKEEDFDILNFHSKKHGNNNENDILMSRNDTLQTVSISQIRFANNNNSTFLYHDLLDENISLVTI
jgi:hypothetical protein